MYLNKYEMTKFKKSYKILINIKKLNEYWVGFLGKKNLNKYGMKHEKIKEVIQNWNIFCALKNGKSKKKT